MEIPPRRVLYLDRGRREKEKGVGTVRSKRPREMRRQERKGEEKDTNHVRTYGLRRTLKYPPNTPTTRTA